MYDMLEAKSQTNKKIKGNESRLPPIFKHSNMLIQASHTFLNLDSIAKFDIDDPDKEEIMSNAPNYEDQVDVEK